MTDRLADRYVEDDAKELVDQVLAAVDRASPENRRRLVFLVLHDALQAEREGSISCSIDAARIAAEHVRKLWPRVLVLVGALAFASGLLTGLLAT